MRRPFAVAAILLGTAVYGSAAVNRSPVVVELFESEGCSSCPPAERAMEALEGEFGGNIIPLIYHVHYWDPYGWKDKFSSKRFTELQSDYAAAFGQDNIYTPEAVVQGEVGFVGSDLDRARREIRKRMGPEQTAVSVDLTPAPQGVQLTAELPKLDGVAVAVIYEDASPVAVEAGENRGETMTGRFAVRDVVSLNVSNGQGRAVLKADKSWDPARLGVVVIIRGPGVAIRSAGSARWPAQNPA